MIQTYKEGVQEVCGPLRCLQCFRPNMKTVVLSDLEFEGMNERYEDITEAHKQTFGWIFEKPSLKFVEWLQQGQGVYWVSGKAGCGKSTLMKFLYQDPRTLESLPKHMPLASKDVRHSFIAGLFFHDRGENPLLKSQEGLFRGILHSILSTYPQLIPIALPARWVRTKQDILSGTSTPVERNWSVKGLKTAFKAIVT